MQKSVDCTPPSPISVEFLSNFQRQASLHKRKVPLLKTFWRRLWRHLQRNCLVKNSTKLLNQSEMKLGQIHRLMYATGNPAGILIPILNHIKKLHDGK